MQLQLHALVHVELQSEMKVVLYCNKCALVYTSKIFICTFITVFFFSAAETKDADVLASINKVEKRKNLFNRGIHYHLLLFIMSF